MIDCDSLVRTKGIDGMTLTIELENETRFQMEKNSWLHCYFYRVDSDLLHSEGECVACDWKRHIAEKTEEELRNWYFIEAWEWPEIWLRRKSQMNSSNRM